MSPARKILARWLDAFRSYHYGDRATGGGYSPSSDDLAHDAEQVLGYPVDADHIQSRLEDGADLRTLAREVAEERVPMD